MTTSTILPSRPLGARDVSALGLGCWAIGGPWRFEGRDAGWGAVDDAQSVRAIRSALDLGVTLFDTADVYGCGHSERVLGRALAGRRDDVLVATKVGLVFDEAARDGAGSDLRPEALRRACEASLRRLGTDRIDLLQLHVEPRDGAQAEEVVATFEELVAAGHVRAYGPSTDSPATARAIGSGPHAVAVQQELSVLAGDAETLAVAEELGLATLARTPLAMGLLTGAYTLDRRPGAGDVRRDTPHWTWFDDEAMPGWLDRLARVRAHLTTDGRTLAQGALAWVWARSPGAIPIPGFRTAEQVEANVAAAALGALPEPAMRAIEAELRPGGGGGAAPS